MGPGWMWFNSLRPGITAMLTGNVLAVTGSVIPVTENCPHSNRKKLAHIEAGERAILWPEVWTHCDLIQVNGCLSEIRTHCVQRWVLVMSGQKFFVRKYIMCILCGNMHYGAGCIHCVRSIRTVFRVTQHPLVCPEYNRKYVRCGRKYTHCPYLCLGPAPRSRRSRDKCGRHFLASLLFMR